MHLDILAFGAHPDDIELSCGGSLAAMIGKGYTVGICDLTRGELGSRGTAETRALEAEKASAILGIHERINLGIPDGDISVNNEYILEIVAVLRHYTPHIILIPAHKDRHLDHEYAHQLLRKSVFMSGMTKIETMYHGITQNPYRPKYMFSYMQSYHFEPDFIVDISEHFSTKIQAIQAYSTQVYVEGQHDDNAPQTFISTPAFMTMLTARSQYLGSLIGASYGEGFKTIEPLGISGFDIWMQ